VITIDAATVEPADMARVEPQDMAHAAPPDMGGPVIACSRELLRNGSFDDTVIDPNLSWPRPVFWLVDDEVLDFDPIEGVNGDYQPHSPPDVIHFGGTGYGVMTTQSIQQGFEIPAGTVQLRFTGWLLVGGYPMPYWRDPFSIVLQWGTNQSEIPLVSATSADVGDWRQVSATLAPPYTNNGAAVILQATVGTDSLGTDFLVDDVSLIADLAPGYCY
jgi:hypothetical protein